MFNPSGKDKEPSKENLTRAATATSSSTKPKKAMTHPSLMRDIQTPPQSNTVLSTKAASNTPLPIEDDTDLHEGARPASRTDNYLASSSTAKKPYSKRSNSRTTSSASRTPAADDPPVAGSSHTAASSKPQFKMTNFTYGEYFPRPIVRYVTNAAEADELVEALNGCVSL